MKYVALLALAFVATAAAVEPQIYKWVDEEGNVHYSDCPPPPSCSPEELRLPEGPSQDDIAKAQQELEQLLAKQRDSKTQRDALREEQQIERERLRVEAMRIAVEKRRDCIVAWQNLQKLLAGRPVFYFNEKGEQLFLDDETHKAEIKRMQQYVAQYCPGPEK